jgi:putative membrane protein insertion efficiency factor
MKRLLVWLLRGYQLLLSPMLGQKCRFYPTCSNYAIEALKVHGAARGSWLALRRVCRCHPWNDGGVDLVPPAGQASSPTACDCRHS